MFSFDQRLRPSATHSPAFMPKSSSWDKAPPPNLSRRRELIRSKPRACCETTGNEVRVAVTPPLIQRKPAISSPRDECEREADEVADKVLQMVEPASTGYSGPAIQRQCTECAEE